jgi:hypothetical protein
MTYSTNIKECLCKKDFPISEYCSDVFKNRKDKLLFKKNNIYEYYFENHGDTIWVIYDKFGDDFTSGMRFHFNKKEDKTNSLFSFHKFFYTDRTSKLVSINEKYQRF